MLCLKKVYNDELLQLTLILSLLRVYSNSYFELDPFIISNNYDFSNGTSWLYQPSVTRSSYVHHKSLDVLLLNYERQLFADLNSLGRYNRITPSNNLNITAYLLNIDRDNDVAEPVPSPHRDEEVPPEPEASGVDAELDVAALASESIELSQEVSCVLRNCLNKEIC